VCAAIDIVVHLARLRGGRRVVWEIAAVEGTRRGEPIVTSLYRFRSRAGVDGTFEAVGWVPDIATMLADRGEPIDLGLFEAGADA
jgi:hypothetical protein